MANLLSILGDITGVLPLVQTLIGGVEALFGSGNGPAKLTAVTTAALSAMQIFAEATGKTLPAAFQADLQAAIHANVQVMNDLGLLLPHTLAGKQ